MAIVLIWAIILVLALVIGWHLAVAILGGIIVIAAAPWLFMITSIVAFSIGILLLFLFSGVGILILLGLGLIWFLLAVILFPIMFPILIPLFIIMLFISYMRRKQKSGRSKK